MNASTQVFLDDDAFAATLDSMDRQDGSMSDEQAEAAVASIEAKIAPVSRITIDGKVHQAAALPRFKVDIDYRKGPSCSPVVSAANEAAAKVEAINWAAKWCGFTGAVKRVTVRLATADDE